MSEDLSKHVCAQDRGLAKGGSGSWCQGPAENTLSLSFICMEERNKLKTVHKILMTKIFGIYIVPLT